MRRGLGVALVLLALAGCSASGSVVYDAPPLATAQAETPPPNGKAFGGVTASDAPVENPVVPVAPEECLIKGNVSYGTGERIYHVPGQAYYDATVINEDHGERWFCTEAEARAAGWRKSHV